MGSVPCFQPEPGGKRGAGGRTVGIKLCTCLICQTIQAQLQSVGLENLQASQSVRRPGRVVVYGPCDLVSYQLQLRHMRQDRIRGRLLDRY